ncbi:MAG: alanine racemase [Deltaproteobacteria bacterium]|jgi:alanine racemase|nr:alanine racemase [Deltaproteobacteria bacterium]
MPTGFLSTEEIDCGLPLARVDLGALRRNWRFLAARGEDMPPLGVVKADAYGHGMPRVARVLLDEGCRMFATGSVAEGVLLRRNFAESGVEGVTILPLLGILDARDADAALRHNLLPLVHSTREAALLKAAHTGSAPLPVAVKIETGMGRLGFRAGQEEELVASLRDSGALSPVLLLSHLASADDPERDESVAIQAGRFLAAYARLREIWPDIAASLANSGAYLARETLPPSFPPQIGRPGLALYGANPFEGTRRQALGAALVPVMSVAAPVLCVHDLPAGASVSYGSVFTAPRPMRVAVVGAGYADGFSRGLSGKGRVCIRGESCPILGRVCMQMHIVDVSHVPEAAAGDEAHLLGGTGPGAVSAAELAAGWGSIPYEVFCALGKNRRRYEE